MTTTKDRVLNKLKNTNGFLSGEHIAQDLTISRAAVNTVVKALIKDGYEILSSTNKGYRLVNSPDIISNGELLSFLPEHRLELVTCVETVDSTNSKLREMAFSGAENGQVFVADTQTKGRGRLGRVFISPPHCGVYMSYLYKPNSDDSNIASITAWTAVAVGNAIAKVCGVRAKTKWVNDLLMNDKKICGILTEMSVEGEISYVQNIIIGIGINVNVSKEDIPSELKKIASSIFAETEAKICRSKLVAEIIKELDIMVAARGFAKTEYLDAYRADSMTVGKKVCVISPLAKREGLAIAINDDFSLKVRFDDGTVENINSGEVSVRGIMSQT